jgi:hypothetical protein
MRAEKGASFRQCHRRRKGRFAVKRIRFSAGIVKVLKQAEVGVPVAEVIRQLGISEQTLCRWKKQYTTPETDWAMFCTFCRKAAAVAE